MDRIKDGVEQTADKGKSHVTITRIGQDSRGRVVTTENVPDFGERRRRKKSSQACSNRVHPHLPNLPTKSSPLAGPGKTSADILREKRVVSVPTLPSKLPRLTPVLHRQGASSVPITPFVSPEGHTPSKHVQRSRIPVASPKSSSGYGTEESPTSMLGGSRLKRRTKTKQLNRRLNPIDDRTPESSPETVKDVSHTRKKRSSKASRKIAPCWQTLATSEDEGIFRGSSPKGLGETYTVIRGTLNATLPLVAGLEDALPEEEGTFRVVAKAFEKVVQPGVASSGEKLEQEVENVRKALGETMTLAKASQHVTLPIVGVGNAERETSFGETMSLPRATLGVDLPTVNSTEQESEAEERSSSTLATMVYHRPVQPKLAPLPVASKASAQPLETIQEVATAPSEREMISEFASQSHQRDLDLALKILSKFVQFVQSDPRRDVRYEYITNSSEERIGVKIDIGHAHDDLDLGFLFLSSILRGNPTKKGGGIECEEELKLGDAPMAHLYSQLEGRFTQTEDKSVSTYTFVMHGANKE